MRKDNGSNNSLILSYQMGLTDGAFFMIKHTPLPDGNHPILSPVCPMGVADTLEHGRWYLRLCGPSMCLSLYMMFNAACKLRHHTVLGFSP